MRILHIASGDLWAGAEAQIFLLLTELSKRPGTTVHSVLMNDGLLAARLSGSGIGVDVLNESAHGAPQILHTLRHILHDYRPDVIHTHRVKENLLGLAANALTVRAPMVRTIHGADEHPASWYSPLKKLKGLADEQSARHLFKRVIAVSEDLATRLRTLQGFRNVVAVPNGIDIDLVCRSQVKAPFTSPNDSIRHIGFIGRLEKVKRADIFLRMAASLSASHTPHWFHFHVFGDGSQRQELERLASAIGVSGWVRFHGHHQEASSWIGCLDAIVMCSDHEGLPMTLLEAMAAGTPVVAHAVGGISEVMRGDIGGKLVYQHEPGAYASAVVEMLRSWSAIHAHIAMERIKKCYSADRTAALTAEVYLSCIESRRRTTIFGH